MTVIGHCEESSRNQLKEAPIFSHQEKQLSMEEAMRDAGMAIDPFHILLSLDVEGRCDKALLEGALSYVVDRQGALRASFRACESAIRQRRRGRLLVTGVAPRGLYRQ